MKAMVLHVRSATSKSEDGVVIILVAVFMLFVVGAMAALAIDVVTLYTARSEAQLAADAAALAGARVLANSGLTSTGAGPAAAEDLARTMAQQVASHNVVGGRPLGPSEVIVSFSDGDTRFATNPHITVQTKRVDLPTFFSRIWGNTALTVTASATAEAYNPSGGSVFGGTATPVAPMCVKPWLLPNIDPSSGSALAPNPIFSTIDGKIALTATGLLGWTYNTPVTGQPMTLACAGGDCTVLPPPAAWQYYPGKDDPADFMAPTHSLPACTPALTSPYQLSVAGCVEVPIACNQVVNIDVSAYPSRNSETSDAVNCLTHSTAGNGDTIVPSTAPPTQPFQFVAGADNPVSGLSPNNVTVSNSLVTVPVFDTSGGAQPTAQIVGFVQLFLNPDGTATPATGNVNATVVNIAGCGTNGVGLQPILGNGASPVVVRLISGP